MRILSNWLLVLVFLIPLFGASQNSPNTLDESHHSFIDRIEDSLINFRFADWAYLDSYLDFHSLAFRTDSAGNFIFHKAQIVKASMLAVSNLRVEALTVFETVYLKAYASSQKAIALESMAGIFLMSNDLNGAKSVLNKYKAINNLEPEKTDYWEMQIAAEKFFQNPKDSLLLQSFIQSLISNLLVDRGVLEATIRKLDLVRFDPQIQPLKAQKYLEEAKQTYVENPEIPIGLAIRIAEAFYNRNVGNEQLAYTQFLKLLRHYQKREEDYAPNFRTQKTLADCVSFFEEYPATPKEVLIEALQLQLKWQKNVFSVYQTFKGTLLEKQMLEALNKETMFNLKAKNSQNEIRLLRLRVYVAILLLFILLAIAFFVSVKLRATRLSDEASFSWLFSNSNKNNGASTQQTNQIDYQRSNQMLAVEISEESAFARNLLEKFKGLTPTDVRVLFAIKQGQTTKEIADSLGISTRGAESAKYRVRKKLGLGDSVDVFNYLNSL